MIIDPKIYSECFGYFLKHATNLLFILTKLGHIVEANHYANSLTKRDLKGVHIRDVILDFPGIFDLSEAMQMPSEEYLLCVSDALGLPQSFYFKFMPVGEHILVFGRLDAEELQTMQKDMLVLNSELNNLTRELHKKNAHLQDALDHVKTLQGILPICMHCHKIRDDRQMWNKIEKYLSEHTDVQLSHSICPECAEKYYPNMGLYDE